MAQRLQNTMKWFWCLFVVYSAPLWRPANSVTTVRTPPGDPSTIEAQAKFFQDFFSVQLSPYKIEFGHVCEDPNTWEQRYEKKDFKNHRDMGKVRWGDKKGGYGEHYWDLNHAGYTDNHGDRGYDDDDSYHEDNHDAFDEPSEQSNNYDTDYTPDDDSHDENNRAKRAHTRHSVTQRKEKVYEDEPAQTRYKPRKAKKHQKEKKEHEESEDRAERQKPLNKEIKKDEEETPKPKEKNNVILVIDHHNREELEEPTTKAENNHFVPYEDGAGVRQHYHPEATAAASAPRLFLEPSTGHIVDRTTGQTYVLQPVRQNFNYN